LDDWKDVRPIKTCITQPQRLSSGTVGGKKLRGILLVQVHLENGCWYGKDGADGDVFTNCYNCVLHFTG